MKNDIAITTISWIRTPEEKEVVLQTISNYSQLNIPIVIVDGGSSESDKEMIKKIPNVKLLEGKNGLTQQLLTAHEEASKYADFLFYTHTDKVQFSKTEAKKMIEAYRKLEKKGVLIPTRTEESWKTYPSYQKKVEDFLNWFVGEYIGIPNDYYLGPKIYPASLIKYRLPQQDELGWGIEAYIYAIAKRLGLSFDFIPVSSSAPQDVGGEKEIKEYRLKVVEWQIKGLLQGQSIDLNPV